MSTIIRMPRGYNEHMDDELMHRGEYSRQGGMGTSRVRSNIMGQYVMCPDMHDYIDAHGWHFSRNACKYACERMKYIRDGKVVSIEPMTKDDVDSLLERYGVNIENKILHDYVFVANMCKADYLGSSVTDDEHLAKFVKDVVDDVDGSDEMPFRLWCIKMVSNGHFIPWDEIL